MKNKQNRTMQDGKSKPGPANQSNEKDISNSLEKDAIGNRGANNYTPMNQTDNELGTEKRRNNR
ncbi:hypothetical protein [Pontibacter fetidus]|uniref:Uncharacterized protein n=1 Tax=Pontibacter fetidus TaxID=2700082 RepID=A0A6B2H5U7_9BACT|nr:hypothetical protein [Pontibacter fetidus]NDK56116.1 hypothetical protein [Pontibacter fetidus]